MNFADMLPSFYSQYAEKNGVFILSLSVICSLAEGRAYVRGTIAIFKEQLTSQ